MIGESERQIETEKSPDTIAQDEVKTPVVDDSLQQEVKPQNEKETLGTSQKETSNGGAVSETKRISRADRKSMETPEEEVADHENATNGKEEIPTDSEKQEVGSDGKHKLKLPDDNDQPEGDGAQENRRKITLESVSDIEKKKKKQKREKKRLAQQKRLDQAQKGEADDNGQTPEIRHRSKLLSRSLNNAEEEILEITKKALVRGTYDEMILRELEEDMSSSDDSSYSSDSSLETDFLSRFSPLPSISQISLDMETVPAVSMGSIVVDSKRPTEEVGSFVDPLTGMPETPSPSIASQREKDVEEAVDEEALYEELSDEFSDLDKISELDLAPPTQLVNEEEDALNFLIDFRASMIHVEEESIIDTENVNLARDLRQITIDFLYKLFDQVVDSVEYIYPQVILSRNLDKMRMVNDLRNLINSYQVEKILNISLNTKTIEYFKRGKTLWPIAKLSPELESKERRKYTEALNHLDHVKKLAATAKIKNNNLMVNVLMDLNIVAFRMANEVELENVIRNALIRKDSNYLKYHVELELRRMSRMRNEISDTRLSLITRQHTLGRLIERMQKFEQITEDLTINEFMRTQREIQNIESRLKELTNDLKKMYRKSTKEMNILTHIREKTQMIAATLKHKKDTLREKYQMKSKLRSKFVALKVQHTRSESRKQELCIEGGLMSKPSLMFDYDATVKQVESRREKVIRLKEKMERLNQRIYIVEKRVSIDSLTK